MNDPRHGPGSSAGDGIAANVEDRFLVAAAIENPRAFESLFTRYWDPIYRYCLYRMGNDEDAEDAAIRILTNAFNALPRFTDNRDSFRSWLFTIAHNEVVSWRRYLSRHPVQSLDLATDLIDPSPLPEEVVIFSSGIREARLLLARLPDRSRQVVELRLAGLSNPEISIVLGISQVAVRQAQSRAVTRMREMMNVDSAREGASGA
jgi:RNA polymerase sigma-70 factor (ECF subfamily)